MFASVLVLLPFAIFATAAASYDSTAAKNAFKQAGLVDVAAVANAFVGLDCSGISVVGTSSGCEANQEPLCCEDNSYNGLVNLGCTPINVNV
ncbi:fungal hydrophobin [Suillus lakei]|nr:fungal hydrophobin [Suillus lakei]